MTFREESASPAGQKGKQFGVEPSALRKVNSVLELVWKEQLLIRSSFWISLWSSASISGSKLGDHCCDKPCSQIKFLLGSSQVPPYPNSCYNVESIRLYQTSLCYSEV